MRFIHMKAQNQLASDVIVGEALSTKLALLSPNLRKEIEAWVVNTVKVKMMVKLDKLLEGQGRENIRKLFLVPIFTIPELTKRVEIQAPEIKTLFFKELVEAIATAEKKLS